jgi:hypothetical protein
VYYDHTGKHIAVLLLNKVAVKVINHYGDEVLKVYWSTASPLRAGGTTPTRPAFLQAA